jgi:hypothetical protein
MRCGVAGVIILRTRGIVVAVASSTTHATHSAFPEYKKYGCSDEKKRKEIVHFFSPF